MRAKPENRVKKQVKEILDVYKPLVYYRMPVSNGMGLPGLDFYGSACGLHFEIETKADHKDLTPRQAKTAGEVEASGAKFFAIQFEDDPQIRALEEWLHRVIMQYHRKQGSLSEQETAYLRGRERG
ncbi:MAG TPA: hypothetical protein VF077_05860 [Nitrospiraceae bacterium]